MKFEEADKMLIEYDNLREFFAKYRSLKNEYDQIVEVENGMSDSPFGYDSSLIVTYSNNGCTCANCSLTPVETLEVLKKHKEFIKLQIETLMKEYNIE